MLHLDVQSKRMVCKTALRHRAISRHSSDVSLDAAAVGYDCTFRCTRPEGELPTTVTANTAYLNVVLVFCHIGKHFSRKKQLLTAAVTVQARYRVPGN